MALAILILIGAGIYVSIKREVQATSKFVIRGKPALVIGLALITGGVLAVALPALLAAIGLLADFVGSLLLSLVVVATSFVFVVFVVVAERRKQVAAASSTASVAVPTDQK